MIGHGRPRDAVLAFIAIVAVYAAVMKRLAPEDTLPDSGAGNA